jgi:hypothetical protein
MSTEVSQNKQAVNAFDDMVSENVSLLPFEQLVPGWHKVSVAMVVFTDDRFKGLRNPVMKSAEELPKWKDPTFQLAVYFEGENRKGATRRFSRHGYFTYDEILKAAPNLAAECTPMGEQGYAVDNNSGVRLISDEKTAKAELILKRFLTAAGVPEGTKGSALGEILHGKELQIEIGAKLYNGKTYTEVINFASLDTPAAELTRIPKPAGVMDHIPATGSM